jgi:4-amino-4-deoxy-L-arabinose transferase-like glycosyltransferase
LRSAATAPNSLGEALPAPEGDLNRASLAALAGMLLIAFILRLALIGLPGYTGDISTFEAWSLTLAQHPIWEFYQSAGFADYPPGYFVVLWFVGNAYTLLVHNDPGYALFKVFVKMPAILMDLGCVALIFAIAQRMASRKWAFGAAALYAFNPATIFISAGWGQVDSVSAAFILLALLLMILSLDRADRTGLLYRVGAWVSLAYSLLIKPHGLILVLLFCAVPFIAADAAARKRGLLWTAAGIGGAFVLAALVSLPFHPTLNPIDLFSWLEKRYAYGSGVYAYNSINAYNLHSVFGVFWNSDAVLQPGFQLFGRSIGLPQYVWGILLVLAGAGLIIWRYLQLRSIQALCEAACLLCLTYFVLSTRMHERYIFNAFVLAMPLAAVLRRYLYATLLITLTLFTNLQYSLWYEYVMNQKLGLNSQDLWPLVDHPMSLINTLVLFLLLFAYLGTRGGEIDDAWLRDATSGLMTALKTARRWFAPAEGVVRMLPIDYGIAIALTVGAFFLSFVNYTYPTDRVFDEIYYARAGEEYLKGVDIFEFTHPPLTKLIITLSMMMFGGLHGLGDTATGWRFLQLVLGALIIFVMYAFAKRLFGSTVFAAAAAGMLLFDGFRFAQSRIATPEMGIALFSLTTAYCFYRYWLARRVRVAPIVTPGLIKREALLMAGATIISLGLTWLITRDARPEQAGDQTVHARLVVFFYWMAGFYTLVRTLTPRYEGVPATASYADGSFVENGVVRAPDGGVLGSKGSAVPGQFSQAGEGGTLVLAERDLEVTYRRDGTASYVTPEGTAEFDPAGTMASGGAVIRAGDGRLWFWLTALSAGLLAASKWNGLFTITTIFLIAGLVVLQGYWPLVATAMEFKVPRRAALWGNPRGFSWDIFFAGIMFVAMSIYAVSYIPYFKLNKNMVDLVELQHGMYAYHHDLKATHPYSSVWYQWPLLQRPIQYYYKDLRIGKDAQDESKCCISDIVALPNPVTWWFGLITIPALAVLAWMERNKGYAMLVALYFIQWLPWIASPRLAFEYHFFPNDAIIVLADAAVLMWLWRNRDAIARQWWLNLLPEYVRFRLVPWFLAIYAIAVVASFVWFYPVVSGQPITHIEWTRRIMDLPKNVPWIGNDRAWI